MRDLFETPEWKMLSKVMCMCWKLFYYHKEMTWATEEAHAWEVDEQNVLEYINEHTVRGNEIRRHNKKN